MYTIYIAEKDPSVIEKLRSDMDWGKLYVRPCGIAFTGEQTLSELARLRPDLLLLDLSLPDLSGAEVLRRARDLGYAGKCILLCDTPSFPMLQQILPLGIRGCLCLPEDFSLLPQLMTDIVLRLRQERIHGTPSQAAGSLPCSSPEIPLSVSASSSSDPAGKSGNAAIRSSRDTILNDVLSYIEAHYHEDLKLELIAPIFGYSSAYLGKIFTRNFGESFNTYIDRCRIEHSKMLLRNEKWKVYEVAAQVGYKSVDYFHKKFHNYVGMSPLAYRRQELGGTL